MNIKLFQEILQTLEGLDYFFFGGIAVTFFSKDRRDFQDMDIALFNQDLYKFAKRVGGKVRRRCIRCGDFLINDFGFKVDFKGQEIEATNSIPRILFDKKVKKSYLGNEVFIQPFESLIAHKALMHRGKDLNDLKLLVRENLDLDFLKKEAERFGKKGLIFSVLRKTGYKV